MRWGLGCIRESKRKFQYSFVIPLFCTTFAATKLIKMIETLLITVLIIAICITLLCVKVIFKKNGKFSSQHIHDSKAMKDRGIHCVMDQDREARKRGGAY